MPTWPTFVPFVTWLIDAERPVLILHALVRTLQAFFVIGVSLFQLLAAMLVVVVVVAAADYVYAAVQLWQWAVGLVVPSTIVVWTGW